MSYMKEGEEKGRIYYAFDEAPPGLYEEAERGARIYLSRRDLLPNFCRGGRRRCYLRLDLEHYYGTLFPYLVSWAYEQDHEKDRPV